MKTAIIIGMTSDMGRELASRYRAEGWTVWGTGRNGLKDVFCEMTLPFDRRYAVDAFRRTGRRWDLLIVAVGTEEPIGSFWACGDEEWERGIQVNALSPLRLVRGLYPYRNPEASICFFSGSGSNGVLPNYSAYCASKILLMKMCELLDAESEDTSIFIMGPGIVRTKIHQETLRAGERAGRNLQRVTDFLNSGEPGTPHDAIFECLEWCRKAGKAAVGGRNIALAHDEWRGEALASVLRHDPDMYKLRRYGNARSVEYLRRMADPEFVGQP